MHRSNLSRTALHRRRLVQALALALIASTAQAASYTAGTESELIQAINDANANAGADVIVLTADIALSAALPPITDALTLHGSGGGRTIRRDDTGANACSPTAANAFRLLDASADLTLTDLTLTGGCNLVDQGGALRVQGANLTVERSTISGNRSFVENPGHDYGAAIGGGVAVLFGSISVTDSEISSNASHGYLAGGGGIGAYQSSVELTRSTISGNRSEGPNPFGPGVYAIGDYVGGVAGTLTIADCTISDNVSEGDFAYGGGVSAFAEAVTIVDSRITGNRTGSPSDDGTYARGAGVNIQNTSSGADTRIERTLISGNAVTATFGFGGGVRAGGGTFTLVDSAVAGNTVDTQSKARAGGLFLETTQAKLVNSTVSGNRISGPVNEGGGGIMLLSEGSDSTSLALFSSTVTNNESLNTNSASAGILFKREDDASVEPTALIESSIVAGNRGRNGFEEIGVASPPSTSPTIVANHALFQGGINIGGGTFTFDTTTLSLWNQDPQLLPLALNGGTIPTHALAPTSPAIDRGSNPDALAFDQRGKPYARVVGAAADIGAYEFDADHVFGSGFD